MKNKTLYLLVSIFILNSITLYHYLSSRNSDYFHHRLRRHSLPEIANLSSSSTTVHHHNSPFPHNNVSLSNSFVVNKPWPISPPSYLPWPISPNNVSHRSCEAYFGNGFSHRVDLLKPKLSGGGGGGWFRCFYSSTLESSVCEGGRIRMNPEKIKMSIGGEKLESVIGRKEEDELPEFEIGAFDLEVDYEIEKMNSRRKKLVDESFLDEYLKKGSVKRHTVRELIDSMQLVGANEFKCSEWIEEPTLLVTRFEYANLFHTVTDWYSAYVSSRVTGLPIRPRLVFVDGHCLTPLDDTWKAMFSSLKYAKHFNGSVCFRHAILPPLGYETVLSRGLFEDVDCQGASALEVSLNPNEPITSRISEFGDMIKASFGLPLNHPHPYPHRNILFIRREGYLAHPRHGGTVQQRLENEQEVFDELKKWASSYRSKCRVNVINGILAHMEMKEQLRAIHEASIIMGAHGAGLTHIVSATQEVEILELIGIDFMRPHYALISKWKGIKYHPMHLGEAYADPSEVIDKVSRMLANMGC